MAFENIAGQDDTARRLRATLQRDRLPHAFLFVGSTGTGRAAMARELAQVVLCEGKDRPDDCCGRCGSCLLFARGAHPDYGEVGLPEGRQSLPIDTVRRVQRSAALKPVRAARRVFVIRDVERMSIEAANCFLKTLEEPPGRCFFVLIASSLRRLPETIVSRCRVVRFANLALEVLQRRLEADGVQPDDARWLARRAWGSPGLADGLKQADLHAFNRELVERLRELSVDDNFALSDWFSKKATENAASAAESRDALQELLECVAAYYRDLALSAAGGTDPAEPFNSALEDVITEPAAGVPPDAFVERAELVLEAIERIGGNAQRRLALDDLFTQLGWLSRGAT